MPKDPSDPGTIEFDFGTPELNDPQYEEKVGGDDGATDAPSADNTQQGRATASEGAQGQGADQQRAAAGDGDRAQQATGADGQQQQQPRGVRADDKGNLVDHEGNIVAAAGAERRHYERAQQQARYITRLERDLEEARGASSLTGVLNDVPSKLGLNLQETEMGLQVIASFKKDPVATARWALQETMRMGYTLAQIVGEATQQGQPVGGSMDLQAVRAMINDAVAPLVGDRATAQRQQQIDAEATRDYEAFVAKHEHAAVHDETLANMLAQDRTLSPEAAYWQLYAYCAKNGFDFAQPLRPQVLARQGQQHQQAPNGGAPQQRTNGQMPMPNGGNPVADMRSDPEMANPDDSWDTIVQQSLRQAGYN